MHVCLCVAFGHGQPLLMANLISLIEEGAGLLETCLPFTSYCFHSLYLFPVCTVVTSVIVIR